MNTKKLKYPVLGATAIASTALVAGLLITSPINADELTDTATVQAVRTQVYEKVASDFNIDAQELEESFRTNRQEVRNEFFTEKLEELLETGEISQDQFDLALEIHEYREANRPEPGEHREEVEDMTPEERREYMQTMRDAERSEMAETLGVSEEEIDSLREVLSDAGMQGPKGPRGSGGEGMRQGLHR